MNLKVGAVVCALAGVGLSGLAGLMEGPFTIIGGAVALKDGDGVTADAVGAQGIATRAARDVSDHSRVRDPKDARIALSEPDVDTGVEDPEEVTLRASLEPVIEEFALEESMVSSDPEDTADAEAITLRASLEPVLEDSRH